MTIPKKPNLKNLILDCKSELLNHTLQNDVVSPHIKSINSFLDECMGILQGSPQDGLHRRRERSQNIQGDARSNILFFAYCMSKWDFQFVNLMTGESFNQSEAFNYLSSALKMKVATLRNYRDTYDSHINQRRSDRVGWKIELNSEYKEIIRQYDSCSEEDLINTGKAILKNIT